MWDKGRQMKYLIAALVVLLVGFSAPRSRAGGPVDRDFTAQVAKALGECSKISPGATREEVGKIFTTEGGLSSARQRTYVYRLCPYIKVDVVFIPSDPKQGAVEERATDVVKSVSRPYLQWSVVD